jgi:hypothetical protein
MNGIAVYFVDESQERFFGFRERGGFEVRNYARDELAIFEEFGRNCGVGFQSKRTGVAGGSESGDQFAQARGDGAGFAHDGLGEAFKMFRRVRLEREHVPDLGVFGALAAREADEVVEGARGFGRLDVPEKHGFHGWTYYRGWFRPGIAIIGFDY